MAIQTKKIIVSDDGNDRELSGQELTDFIAQQAKDKAESDALIAANEAKIAQRSALLERLGLTEDEAKLLLS
jgi:hypothetical protein